MNLKAGKSKIQPLTTFKFIPEKKKEKEQEIIIFLANHGNITKKLSKIYQKIIWETYTTTYILLY